LNLTLTEGLTVEIEILLNPKSPNYADFIADLDDELGALKGLKYKQVEAPAPPKTLNLEHDIVKLVFEHGADALKLVVALIQLTQAVADRRKKPDDGKAGVRVDDPVAVLKIDDRTIAFPASDRTQRSLIEAVRSGKTKKAKKKLIPKKKSGKPVHKKSR
jgi:hypothetical protein